MPYVFVQHKQSPFELKASFDASYLTFLHQLTLDFIGTHRHIGCGDRLVHLYDVLYFLRGLLCQMENGCTYSSDEGI